MMCSKIFHRVFYGPWIMFIKPGNLPEIGFSHTPGYAVWFWQTLGDAHPVLYVVQSNLDYPGSVGRKGARNFKFARNYEVFIKFNNKQYLSTAKNGQSTKS